jgi:hypothetical protein
MNLHFTEHYGHVEGGREGAHLLNWQRVIFVTCMTVFFLVIFVFL